MKNNPDVAKPLKDQKTLLLGYFPIQKNLFRSRIWVTMLNPSMVIL